MSDKAAMRKKALKAAFPKTWAVMPGMIFFGLAYGVYLNVSGFSFLYPMFMSLLIFAGSMELVAVGLLLGPFDPVNAFVLTIMINARHLFYGLSMLETYNIPGLRKLYLIFGMCDENFSINCTLEVPEGVDKSWMMFFITLLNHSYWVIGSTVGGILGSFVQFNTTGIDFVMTGLFVVIFLEQLLKEKTHYSSLLGFFISLLCLLIFRGTNFLIPAMLLILGVLSLLRKPLEKAGGAE